MDRWVGEVLSRLGDDHLNFLIAPAKDPRKDSRRVRFNGLDLLNALQLSNLL